MKKISFLLFSLILACSSIFSQEVAGTWNGTLDLGVQKLRVVFHIETVDGGYAATMDSPDQGATGIPLTSVNFSDGTLTINDNAMGMTYEGKVGEHLIEGTFRQGGLVVPLELKRGGTEPPRRPQTPSEPYPYISEDITFRNDEAGIILAGTLTYPSAGDKFPAVILLTGSGPQDRNEEVFDHKPFLVIADHLTRNGIAVLRFDDRGTALSEGDYDAAAIQDFATDASAAMDYLKTRKEIDPGRTGLLGHSEGGQIAFITAAGRSDVAFIVTMAGPGIKGEELLKEQRRLIYASQGAPRDFTEMNEALIALMNDRLEKYGVDNLEDNMLLMVDEVMEAAPEGIKAAADLRTILPAEFRRMASAELRSLTEYDPAGDLARIKCPILALNGDKDLQVPADLNLNGIRARYDDDLTIKKYPDLNHLFQHSVTGQVTEYSQIEETISPGVMADISEWINLKMKK